MGKVIQSARLNLSLKKFTQICFCRNCFLALIITAALNLSRSQKDKESHQEVIGRKDTYKANHRVKQGGSWIL